MSATRYKKTHVDILMCIEMTRERNLGIKKTPGIYRYNLLFINRCVRGQKDAECGRLIDYRQLL